MLKLRLSTILGLLFSILSIIMGMSISLHAQTCPSDMIHYWKLDENNAPYSDSYGNNDATCTNCPTAVEGTIDGAQQFNESNQVDVADDDTFDWGSGSSFSIEFWMKGNVNTCSTGSQVVIGRSDPSTPLYWWVGCRYNSRVAAFGLADKSGTALEIEGSKDLTDGSWHHVVAVRDADNHENCIYVDGIKEVSASITYADGFDSASPLNIGWINAESGYHFDGAVDEVALYNRALVDVEIRSHYYIARGYCDLCNTPIKIMPLGDSITRGTIPNETDSIGFRRKLNLDMTDAGYNVDFVGSLQDPSYVIDFDRDHEGHGGYTADQVAAEVNGWLSAVTGQPDIVLLHIGTNDISDPNETTQQTAQEVATILNNIDSYSKKTTVILSRIISRTDGLDQKTKQFNIDVATMANNRIAQGDKIRIVDHEDALIYPDDICTEDDVHPNMAGYNKMADVWFNGLVDILPICGFVAPSIISAPITEAGIGVPYTYDVNAIGSPLPTYSLTTAPNAMSINQTTGLIEWTPAEVGTVNVNVVAANAVNTDTQSFAIDVVEYPLDMVHYWKFDEPKGPLYHDYYGNSDAFCTNCPVSITGIVKGAQQFGSDEKAFVYNGGVCNWGSNDSFSIEFWMKGNVNTCSTGSQVVIGRSDPSTPLYWWVGCRHNSRVAAFGLADKSGTALEIEGSTDLTDGSWHHVVAVRDADNHENCIYVDGIKEVSASITYTDGFDSASPLNIGWINAESGYHFNGAVDEVAIYNRTLSEVEILHHVNSGLEDGVGYRAVKYTITASAGSGGGISPSGAVSVNYGEDQTFTITPDTNYHVADVAVDGSSAGAVTSYTFTNVVANHTISASFAINTHTITASAGANGSISPSGAVSVNHGSNQTFTITPAANYHVADVAVDGSSAGAVTSYTFTNVIANHTIAATFAINSYTITATAGSGGDISPSGAVSVNYGADQTFAITPNTGYHIEDVKVDGSSLGAVPSYLFSNITANHTIEATFTSYTEVILFAPTDGETISSGSTYPISWEAPPEVVKFFRLLYSLDNGITWTVIADNVTDKFRNWTVPKPSGNKKGIVKVLGFKSKGVKAGADSSTFTIEVVKLTSPNGGDTFAPGDSSTITWRTNATKNDIPVAKVKLYYTTDAGVTWNPICDSVTGKCALLGNPEIYQWTVPTVRRTKEKCKVRVVLLDRLGSVLGTDASDDYFTIEGPVEITSPNGGETLIPGSTSTIVWTTNIAIEATVAKVKLYYTKDGGVTWNPICDSLTGKCALTGNPGSYGWIVPAVGKTKENCRVRVELKDASGNILAADSSDDYFKIYKP